MMQVPLQLVSCSITVDGEKTETVCIHSHYWDQDVDAVTMGVASIPLEVRMGWYCDKSVNHPARHSNSGSKSVFLQGVPA